MTIQSTESLISLALEIEILVKKSLKPNPKKKHRKRLKALSAAMSEHLMDIQAEKDFALAGGSRNEASVK